MSVNNKIKQNVATGLEINWFPGHMKKSTEEIQKIVSKVDLVIEVVDARAIKTSSNDELVKIVNHKPLLKIALKSDYSDLSNENDNLIIASIKDKNLRTEIISKINLALAERFESYRKKGLLNPKFLIMVIGLPNVGKSSLINVLKTKKILNVMNMPGVTKHQRIIAINNNLNLVDTPGVLFKHISDINDAYKLTLINCIKKEVVPLDQVLNYGFNHYYKFHKNELFNYYKINDIGNYVEFVNELAKKRKWYNKSGIDLNRIETNLFNDFSTAKICKTNFEK